MKEIKYQYKNAPIPGGGYATGFVFQPADPGRIYLRTDIGGSYRFDPETKVWKSLSDHLTMEQRDETYPIALAVDERHPERLFIASGLWNRNGKFSYSQDKGETFQVYDMPVMIHGNMPGRGTGYHMIVDKLDENSLYFASQTQGLWRTPDLGKSWEKITAMPEEYLTFVGQTKDGSALIVGAAGVTTKKSEICSGDALYVSYDRGQTFETLWQPEYAGPEEVPVDEAMLRAAGTPAGFRPPRILRGPVAQRYAIDDKYLYVTFASRCEAFYRPELGYSCDAGKVTDGHVVRYELAVSSAVSAEGIAGTVTRIVAFQDITPDRDKRCVPDYPGAKQPCLHLGFSGIDVCPQMPGLLICSTIRKSKGDSIYRSLDYGTTWQEIMHDLDVGKVTLRTSYMKPEYNSRHSMVHWMSDLKINPCDANEAWFNTGSGVFCTHDLLAETVEFTDWSDGVEETVHINVYAPPAGEVLLLDILGDLGGFAFRKLDEPCDNSFADAEGNRYVTCLNADYSDNNPDLVAVTPRGNWTGMTKGGLIVSKDNCKTFRRLPMPFGLSEILDEALHRIERPNVNSGWVAMSPDGQNLVWSVARGIQLPVEMVVVSHDGGESFKKVTVQEKNTGGFKVFSDRMDSSLFYGFGDHSDLYLSKDGGETFRPLQVEGLEGEINFTIIDCADKTEVRGESGKSGVFYFSAGELGLWKLVVSKDDMTAKAIRLGNPEDKFYHLGLGILRPDGDYMAEEKALYVNANIGDVYGFFRSLDQGETFEKLNNDRQCFGDINSIDADKRVFGRFFIGTGSRGVLYGEMI